MNFTPGLTEPYYVKGWSPAAGRNSKDQLLVTSEDGQKFHSVKQTKVEDLDNFLEIFCYPPKKNCHSVFKNINMTINAAAK